MNRYDLLVALALAFAAGCASMVDNSKGAGYEEKEYVTGSRIPVKEKTSSNSVKTTTDPKAINDMVRPGGKATGGVSGAGGS